MRVDELLDAALAELDERPLGWLLAELFRRPGAPRVIAAEGIGTARLRALRQGAVIEVDPEFVEKEVRSPADALFVLGHELLHWTHGDLARGVDVGPATWWLLNVALDVFVNAHLERLWFNGEGAPVQRRLYRPDAFPQLLLLSPRPLASDLGTPEARRFLESGWENARWDCLTRALEPRLRLLGLTHPDRLARLYTNAWSAKIDFRTFWRELRSALGPDLPRVIDVPVFLMGHHPGPGLRQKLPRWLQRLLRRLSMGVGFGLEARDIEPDRRVWEVERLLQGVRRTLTDDHRDPVTRRKLAPTRTVVGAQVGRREALSLATGARPIFWRAELPEVSEAQSLHLYIDVSASMDEALPIITRMVDLLGEHLAQRIYLFSTRVVSGTLQDVGRGRLHTTGGTSFDCVLRHALERRWTRLLLVTDGNAHCEEALISRASGAGLEVNVLLVPLFLDTEDHPLRPLGGNTWTLPISPSCPF